MKKVNRAQQQPQTKGDWPPKSPCVSQATSKMTDEIKELLHDTINTGVQNNRMLKWLVVRCNVDGIENASFHADEEKAKKLLEAAEHLAVDLPDISDILEEK